MIYCSIIGLAINTIGSLFLFLYGLPSMIKDTKNEDTISTGPTSNKEEIKRERSNKHIHTMSRIGLGMILIGFIFQFIGTLASLK